MYRERTAFLIAFALMALSVASVSAQTSDQPAPDAVEEDWELVVDNPDPISVGPQITTVLRPSADQPDQFIAFDMNYREYPSFASGGMQVQVWSGGKVIGTSSQGNALFNTSGEVVTWTQRISVGDGKMSYDVKNGQSTTWGNFGQVERLGVTFASTLGNLAGYSAAVTASGSGASWKSNNVKSLKLVQVRYLAKGQIIGIDSNPRVLIAPPDASN